MTIKHIVTGAFLGSLLFTAGCVSPPPSTANWNVATVKTNVVVSRDNFKKQTQVVTPEVYFRQHSALGVMNLSVYGFYRLGATRADGNPATYFVQVNTANAHSAGWSFWIEAYDKDGAKFPLAEISQDTDNYGVKEASVAGVTREYLNAASKTGTTWKIYGKRDQAAFDIPPNLIQGFLEKCDEQFHP